MTTVTSFANGDLGSSIRTMLNDAMYETYLGKPVSILHYIPRTQHAAIFARTSTYDIFADLETALADIALSQLPGAIYWPPGRYKCNSTINLKQQVRFIGDGMGQAGTWSTSIVFPADVNGIDIHRHDTDETGIIAPSTPADGSILDGIGLVGGGGSGDAYGVRMRARALLRNASISGFSGNGIHIVASSDGTSDPDLYGNANLWQIIGGSSQNNGGHGLFVSGADANAGFALGMNLSDNAGWGVMDDSFLGNTYLALHTAGNTLGPYATVDANAKSVFIGCYSEGGQPSSAVLIPSLIIGGALHDTSDCTCGIIDAVSSSGLRLTPLSVVSGGVTSELGNGGAVFSGAQTDELPWRFRFSGSDQEYNYGNLGAGNAFIVSGHNTDRLDSGGRPNPVKYALEVPRLFPGEGAAARRITFAGSEPTSGDWARGDRVYNNAPVAGGAEGWICVTGGVGGVDAVFKEFGAIAA